MVGSHLRLICCMFAQSKEKHICEHGYVLYTLSHGCCKKCKPSRLICRRQSERLIENLENSPTQAVPAHNFFTTTSWCYSRCHWLTYILDLGGRMLFSRLWTSLPIMASKQSRASSMSHAFRRGRTIGKPIAHLAI